MKLKIYQVDAFTNQVFAGNPAAVCPLDSWQADVLLQNIASENNLAETAFFTKKGDDFHIRWFTPKAEVDLCGHATLATAYVIFGRMGYTGDAISFDSRSGILTVTKEQDWLTLDFRITPKEVYKGSTDLMFVFDKTQEVQNAQPDLTAITRLNGRGIIITTPGSDTDFISRFFAPAVGINEDPVTGSAHTTLTPYWANRWEKNELTARQVSERGGYLKCALKGNRVAISGQAAFYMEGEISV